LGCRRSWWQVAGAGLWKLLKIAQPGGED
jgi:hypothetical protein